MSTANSAVRNRRYVGYDYIVAVALTVGMLGMLAALL